MKDSYLEYTDNSQNSTVMKPTIEPGNGKRYEEHFRQREYTDGKRAHKIDVNITSRWGNANEDLDEISLHTYQNSKNTDL